MKRFMTQKKYKVIVTRKTSVKMLIWAANKAAAEKEALTEFKKQDHKYDDTAECEFISCLYMNRVCDSTDGDYNDYCENEKCDKNKDKTHCDLETGECERCSYYEPKQPHRPNCRDCANWQHKGNVGCCSLWQRCDFSPKKFRGRHKKNE